MSDIAPYEHPQLPTAAVTWSQQDVDVIRNSLASGLSEPQFTYFLSAAKRSGLDPLKREIYAWVADGRVILHTGINGAVKLADATGSFRGFTEPIVTVRENGKLQDIPPRKFEQGEHSLHAVTVGARHSNDPEPAWATALYSEYVVMAGDRPNKRWERAPLTQLTKCAQALALRRRFSAVLGDIYVTEELEHLESEDSSHPKAKNQKKKNTEDLTVAAALKMGGAHCRALGMADGNASAAAQLFLSSWNKKNKTAYATPNEIPDTEAEAVLDFLRSSEFEAELRGEAILPIKRNEE